MPFSEAELMMKPSTSDPELIQAILENILIAIKRIERRFEGINSPDDFVADDEGISHQHTERRLSSTWPLPPY
jgi:hypothetical protein